MTVCHLINQLTIPLLVLALNGQPIGHSNRQSLRLSTVLLIFRENPTYSSTFICQIILQCIILRLCLRNLPVLAMFAL